MPISRLKTILISHKDDTLPHKDNTLPYKANTLPPTLQITLFTTFLLRTVASSRSHKNETKVQNAPENHPDILTYLVKFNCQKFFISQPSALSYSHEVSAVILLWDIFLCSVDIPPTWTRLAFTYNILLHCHTGVHILHDTREYLRIPVTT